MLAIAVSSAALLPGGDLLAQNRNVSIEVSRKSLKSVLEEIEKSTGFTFMYNSSLIDIRQTVDLKSGNEDISKVLDKLLKSRGISYEIRGKQIVLSPMKSQNQESSSRKDKIDVTGVVKDRMTGEPVPGAVIYLKSDNSFSAVTDLDGHYSIKGVPADGVLVCQMVGMEQKESEISGRSKLDISLDQDIIALEDVVVTGYQTISKERSAGSYAVITTEKIETKLQTNIMDRLEGMVAGLQMFKGKPVIRGTSTIYADKNPLYVVDGVPFEGDIDMINPNDIVNVSVLKDATAASIYGARSTNGVIVITTRSGQAGKLNISYNGTVSFQPLPDRSYDNLMSSSEFVDFQIEMFNEGVAETDSPTDGYALNDVYRLLFDRRDGKITDEYFNSEIARYKSLDRYDQVVDELLNKVNMTNQHNLSFNGGTDFYRYSFSLNYTGSSPYDKGQYQDRIGFNVKNNFNFTKWFQVDVGLMGNSIDDSYYNGFSGFSYLNGGGMASYYMLRDEEGNPMKWEYGKSREEVERLNSLGLVDESFYPLSENEQRLSVTQSQYINFNLGARFNILDNLNLELRYQTEKGSAYYKTYKTKDLYEVRSMINNATVINPDGSVTNHIPMGGQVSETNKRTNSYTMRAQLNYHDTFADKHDVTFLAGAERRRVTADQNGLYRYGYDDYNLSYKNINEVELRGGIYGTEALGGYFGLYGNNPTISSVDDRYVSFYANASYTYNDRLSASASIRMDQSNLFGTDPKYQYRPLWSVGANYQIFKSGEVSWIDRLSVRATYGINGNVYKESGPYIISKVASWPNWNTNENYAEITSPPNSALRWEKTHTTNVGVDFGFFGNRLNGSVEYYFKKTNDMLGYRESDPTLGWDQLLQNYASMRNTGVEVVLESVNINTRDFRWNTSLMFSYNSNKILELQESGTSSYSYYNYLQSREGKPYNSLYSIRYAGLDATGKPQAYKADGTKVQSTSDIDVEDLVYSGTYDPPYTASMTNTLSYKGFELSFMFVYYGGHVIRDVASAMYLRDYQVYYGYTSNMDRLYLDRWKQPGDESDIYCIPAYYNSAPNSLTNIWNAADIHVQPADYIKLRDISISYTFPSRWIEKIKMSNLKLTFQAQNLWMWTANRNHLDPEVWTGTQLTYASRGTKVPPTFVLGLNINF